MFSINLKCTDQLLTKSVFRNLCIRAAKPKHPGSQTATPKKNKSYGQPMYQTHPHLLKEGEVTPLITRSEYQERRQRLIETIATHALKRNKDIKKHLIIIPGASKQYMSDKIPYVFRQNTDFLYLSGCQEPDSCLVLSAAESPSDHCVSLFLRDRDAHSEKWDGPRTGSEEAIEMFGVEQALPMSELQNYLQCYMKSNRSSTLWYDYMSPVQTTVHKVMCDYLNEIINKVWESPKPFIHRLRLIKSPAEAQLLQKSCDIASQAFRNTIAFSEPGISEHQIFAHVDYECRMNGAEFLAYPPVVASGDRANTIHYIDNNQLVHPGEMVLMDAGCEYHGYSSDITRTWPISGTFTAPQKALYEAVLSVQMELIELCKELPTLDNLFDDMCRLLGRRLKLISLVSPHATGQMLLKAVYELCPHHVSHYLGMDVHDTSLIPRNIKLQPGMVITVEPGVYISSKNENVPKEFRGMGVRIEDDVLITENGPVVLSRNCPKSVIDVETLAKRNLS